MLDTIVKIVGMIATALAVLTFWRNVRLKRAEWLYQLHAKFYESTNYKKIRLILDYRPEPEYSNLRQSTTNGDTKLAEELVDYLNFFEFIAILWQIRQLTRRELGMMFEYYLADLKKHPFVLEYLKKEGFESLSKLLKSLPTHRRR